MGDKMNASHCFWLLVVGCWLLVAGVVLALPVGPDSLSFGSNETWSGSSSGELVNISGGYVADFDISAEAQNPHWKAFLGYLDGSFVLEDSSGSLIYNWTISSISGEVYATRASGSISWGTISCADAGELLAEDVAMEHVGQDNISSTFNVTNTGTYAVAGTTINPGDCSSLNSYVNNASQGASFEEFVLHDSSNIVFGTEIEDEATGYDGGVYDFQMIVPENGNESFGGSTAYYLYVELN